MNRPKYPFQLLLNIEISFVHPISAPTFHSITELTANRNSTVQSSRHVWRRRSWFHSCSVTSFDLSCGALLWGSAATQRIKAISFRSQSVFPRSRRPTVLVSKYLRSLSSCCPQWQDGGWDTRGSTCSVWRRSLDRCPLWEKVSLA